jgi:hypothetical protein
MDTDTQRIAHAQAQDYELRALRYFAAAEAILYDPDVELEHLLSGTASCTIRRNGARWIIDVTMDGGEQVRGSGGSIDMALADAFTMAGEAMAAERDALKVLR